MKYNMANEMIQEVDYGKNAGEVVKSFVEGETAEEDVVEEKPLTSVEQAKRFPEKRGVVSE